MGEIFENEFVSFGKAVKTKPDGRSVPFGLLVNSEKGSRKYSIFFGKWKKEIGVDYFGILVSCEKKIRFD